MVSARAAPSGVECHGHRERSCLPDGPGGLAGVRLDPPQLLDEGGPRQAVDELHGVEVHAPLAAHGVYRHDVGVVQMGRGHRFVLEALELLGVQRRGEGKDLQGDAAAE